MRAIYLSPRNSIAIRGAMAKTIPTKTIYRSAETGRFVKEEFAKKHPKTTEKEHVPISNPKV